MRNGNIDKEGIWGTEDLESKASKPKQWGVISSDAYKALSFTKPKLPAGVYGITKDMNDSQAIYIRKDVVADESSSLSGSFAQEVIDEIGGFWDKAKIFADNGFLHRRGYMLYGPQGTGKSSIVHQIIRDVVINDGVVFLCNNPAFFSLGLKTFRQIEPDRKVVCVFEDIDAIIKAYGEDELLSILDGGNQIDHVVNIATTNYPELLDKRIVSRPRRFDRIHKVLAPNAAVRRSYLKMKLPKGQNVEKWLKLTEGLSFASLAEAVVSVLCLGNKLEDTVVILRGIEGGNPSSEDFEANKRRLGFDSDDFGGGGNDEDDDEDDDIPVRPRKGSSPKKILETISVSAKKKPKFKN